MDFRFRLEILKALKNKNIRLWLWIAIASLFSGAFLLFSSEVREASAGEPELIGVIDLYATSILGNIRSASLTGSAIDITSLGSTTVITIFVSFGAILLVLKRRYLQASQLILAGLGSATLSLTLKSHFERPRPDSIIHLVDVDGYSYPSGHSLVSSAVYFTLAILLCQDFQKPLERLLIISFAFIFILFVALSRVYLGVHYVSDTVAGVLVGVSWAATLGACSSFYKMRGRVS